MDAISSLISSSISNISTNQLPSTTGGVDPTQQVSGDEFLGRLEKLKSMKSEQIDKMAKDFESVFVSMLLKEMRNTLDTGDGGLFGSEQSDTFGGMFDQFMGEHMADSSPLGIADAIKGYLKNKPLEA